MTRKLKTGRRDPASGMTRSVVVFLHGYGADGADLLGLAEPLAPHLPDTLFLAPDAPEPCAINPMGRQWFAIPRMHGATEQEAAEGLERAAADLDAFLDAMLEEEGVTPSQVILFGFSQGTMISLHVAPRRAEALAGVVGFSGRLIGGPTRLAEEAVTKPPVILIHGDADDVVPFGHLHEAAEALSRAGFETYGHVMKGTGHGIAPDGLSVALTFLREKLPG